MAAMGLPRSNNTGARFMNDLSVGYSRTTENHIMLNLKCHFHETGFPSRA
jgi:hypothetical protein